jgi:hypothetical protein
LKTIELEPMHGGPIAKRLQQVWGKLLQVHEGSLDPALHRLKQQAPVYMEARSAWQDEQGQISGAGAARPER